MAAAGVVGKRVRWVPPRLLIAAVALRIVGATIRYEVGERFYHGVVDAGRYFQYGWQFAEKLWAFDLSVFSADVWLSGQWWGTQFLRNLSGLAVSIVGPSMRAEFLLFSLASFWGLYLTALAFARYYPGLAARRYAAFIWLWPSLWFWPSSVGKEAVIILGIGMTLLGFAGQKGRPTWWLLATGLVFIFCIRPHFAFVLAFSMVAAGWLARWRGFSPRRVAEVVFALVIAAVAFKGMVAQFGIGDADLEGMQEFAEYRAELSLRGGSSIGGTALTGAGLPLAVINVWFRPFLFEAHNPMAAFAALEILLFWYLVWRNRKAVAAALKRWRESRLLRFALPFVVVFTLMIGMVMGNLGLLARQRTPLFPFAFMVVAAGSVLVPVRRKVTRRWVMRTEQWRSQEPIEG